MQLVIRDGEGPRMVDQAVIPFADRAGTYQWEALYRAIKGEKLEDTVTPAQIAEGIAVVEAMAKAEQTGTRVLVNNPHVVAKAPARC